MSKTECEHFCRIVKGGRVFDFDQKFPTREDLPINGVYIMLDVDESGCYRVVRIGINKKRSLFDRLSKHKQGTIRNSIFRKHLFRILNSEQAVTNYLRQNISFVVIDDTDNVREDLEKRIICGISNCKERVVFSDWLGSQSVNKKIRESGLWNVQHVFGGYAITKSDLAYCEKNLLK